MQWQFNWRVWQWPWHTATLEAYYWSHFAGFGPFQFHWISSKQRIL